MADYAIHKAFDSKFYKKIDILLNLGANPNSQDDNGYTLLTKCIHLHDQSEAVSLMVRLLEKGASVDMSDNRGRTPLFHAVLKNKLKMVKLLLNESDLDLNRKDKTGSTVLHLAAEKGFYQIACLLASLYRKYHSNIDVINRDGMTALHVACARGHYDIAKALVYGGNASLSIRDDVQFYSAREWLAESLHFPPQIDPFPHASELRKKYTISSAAIVQAIQERHRAKTAPGQRENETRENVTKSTQKENRNTIARCKSAQLSSIKDKNVSSRCKSTALELKYLNRDKNKSNINRNKLDKNRIKSAPMTITCEEMWNYDPVMKARKMGLNVDDALIEHGRALLHKDSPSVKKGSFFQSASFRSLYELYTIQSSASFKPPAIQPSPRGLPLEEDVVKDVAFTSRKTGHSRGKMQKAMRKMAGSRQLTSPTPSGASSRRPSIPQLPRQAFSDPGSSLQQPEVSAKSGSRRRSFQKENLSLNLDQLKESASSLGSERSNSSKKTQ